ncbi:DnaJ family domain-containing protein [Tateyamaria sp.]|uniref:DnaJ family domain-containing protein n=1 Tax=Tateyamaria sp. TaxID=1929288 RepID=UPI003B21B044
MSDHIETNSDQAMLRSLRNLVERQIAKTQATGGLSGLKGEGKPLPYRSAHEDAGQSAGMRMMVEAGVVPEEFKLKQALDAARLCCIN